MVILNNIYILRFSIIAIPLHEYTAFGKICFKRGHFNDANISINDASTFFSIISFKAISRFVFINASSELDATFPSDPFIPLADIGAANQRAVTV